MRAAVAFRRISTRRRSAVRASQSTFAEKLESRAMLTTVVVNTTIDAVFPSGSGIVSLRNAIATANSSNFAPTTITFDPTVFATPRTITLVQGALSLTSSSAAITISGSAAGVTISGNGGQFDVFDVQSHVTVNLSQLRITDSGLSGITVYSSASLTLSNATVSNNNQAAVNNGGGIAIASGTAVLTNVTISGNVGSAVGGGIENNGGTATLTNCTVVGNSINSGYSEGAGIFSSQSATTTLVNCTIAGNSVTGSAPLGYGIEGGGVFASGQLTVSDCTIVGNTANTGGGIASFGQFTASIANTIVASNTASGNGASGPDVSGSFNSLGFNLIGETDGSSGWNFEDVTGTATHPLNPTLAPLGNYGGPTQTMPPLAGSPVVDGGSNALALDAKYNPLTTDQRDEARIYNGTADIGAVEFQPKAINCVVGNDLTLEQSADHSSIVWTVGGNTGQFSVGDPEGLNLGGSGGNDVIVLDYTNGSPLPGVLHLSGTFTINGLTGSNPLANTTLDIGSSTVFITYPDAASDPLAAIQGYLKNGYNGGNWNGTSLNGSIQSSVATATPLVNSIGYADSADTANPANLPANTIELRYTIIGDTNLDGTVGLTDLAALLKSFNTGTQWDQGDLSYGTTVGLTDLAALLKHFGQTASSPAAWPAKTPTLSAAPLLTSNRAIDLNLPKSTADQTTMPTVIVKPVQVKSHAKRHRQV